MTGASMLVSAATTAARVDAGADADLRDALAAFTASRFGRGDAAVPLDDALSQGMAAAARIASRHAWWREALRGIAARVRAAGGRVWAR